MLNFRNIEIVCVFALLAIAARVIPLQHYIPLARYQHWAIALFIAGLGYVIQTGWSWSKVTWLARLALSLAAIYLVSAAATLYYNPWLDPSISLETTEQASMRFVICTACSITGLVVAIVWLLWAVESQKEQRKKEA